MGKTRFEKKLKIFLTLKIFDLDWRLALTSQCNETPKVQSPFHVIRTGRVPLPVLPFEFHCDAGTLIGLQFGKIFSLRIISES